MLQISAVSLVTGREEPKIILFDPQREERIILKFAFKFFVSKDLLWNGNPSVIIVESNTKLAYPMIDHSPF